MSTHKEVFTKLITSGSNLCSTNVYAENDIAYSYGYHFPLMVPVDEKKYWLINADRRSVSTATHQSHANRAAGYAAVAIPFSALELAGIPAYKYPTRLKKQISIVDMISGIWDTRTRINSQTNEIEQYQEHTLGASLIKYKSAEMTKPQYYISGIDETGISGRGYFLTQLKRPAKTVKEALEQLKPTKILKADQKNIPYVRQGEYFFIAVPNMKVSKSQIIKGYLIPDKDSTNSHHKARDAHTYGKQIFVRGSVRHIRGDHRLLNLGETWHEVILNNQKHSFNASGGFD